MKSLFFKKFSSNSFTPPHPLKTAVLFLVFNRPDTTKQVFEAIRQAKPPRLYVAADGPRADKAGEVEKVEQARRIATQVDWECEVKTLFRDKNLGCGKAVSSAITWFFENEEEGIILEDDCLPSQSFFWFCEELLEQYREDMRIWMITGRNNLGNWTPIESSYFYSKLPAIWGWATWKRTWCHYDFNILLWRNAYTRKRVQDFVGIEFFASREKAFNKTFNKEIDTWDYQWAFSQYCNSGITVVPTYNLIENIGFGENGTHTSDANSIFSKIKKNEIEYPLKHNDLIVSDLDYDRQVISNAKRNVFKAIFFKILNKLRRN